MLKLAGLENLAETELGRITTKTQQEKYIEQIMAPELKNFLDKIPALRKRSIHAAFQVHIFNFRSKSTFPYFESAL